MTGIEKKEYRILQPVKTHTRAATCEEYGCKHFTYGWKTKVDISTDLGQRQQAFIAGDRTRHATAEISGTIVTYTFAPGQTCFNSGSHRIPLDRPAVFITRDRGNLMRHSSADPWVDDFATHQERLYRAQNG